MLLQLDGMAVVIDDGDATQIKHTNSSIYVLHPCFAGCQVLFSFYHVWKIEARCGLLLGLIIGERRQNSTLPLLSYHIERRPWLEVAALGVLASGWIAVSAPIAYLILGH